MEIPGYFIEKQIGKGGMASVYLATQESLSRPVVLKVLDISDAEKSQELIERFLSEGRIVASLNHPNIITIHDIGITDDNTLYISMEYIQGGDLKSRIQIPFDPDEALELLVRIGGALKTAHSHGVIHRDIKPANILFRDNDTPLITDFGIAKRLNEDLNLTSTGIFLGSPNYVSPEQADGKEVDGRTDIYSLGCIFYEMLTGKKPYPAETVFDVVLQHKRSPVPQLPEDLLEFQPLLDRMMAKDPEERFENAAGMIEYIQQLQIERNRKRALPDIDITGEMGGQRKKKKVSVVLIVLLILSAGFFFSLQYIDIRLKDPGRAIREEPVAARDSFTATVPASETAGAPGTPPAEEASEDVINALLWLGKNSLEEYRLTYPPKDNAYYYYSRLLEISPNNRNAAQGILEIADRYAILAERSLAENDIAKAETYINIGLKINPQNKTLLSLEKLNQDIGNQSQSLPDRLKSLF